jgi:hypothetical protein
MTDTVAMTKDNGGTIATANVPADAVPVWEADGWKVAPTDAPKGKK